MTSFSDLQAWAMAQVSADFESVKRQITEYGSIDLDIMGIGMLEISGVPIPSLIPPTDGQDAPGTEMALIFYLLGKISRCISAIAAGQRPSNDSYKDLRVYSFMLGHVREFGHWRITMDKEGTTDATAH